jgi:arsenical pump membrane protein
LLRGFFARELSVEPTRDTVPADVKVPVFAVVVLALTLAGFAVTSLFGWSPAWAALAGAIVLGVHGLIRGRSTVAGIANALDVPFLAFVLCLGVVVAAVMLNGLDGAMREVLPTGDTLPALLGIAGVAALLSNVVNNLPAVLVLLPLVTTAGPAAVLAVLIGVNVGPNLTYVGSLANLLWRSVVRRDIRAGFVEFSRIGLVTTPITLAIAVLGLWVGIRLFGV